MMLAGSLKQRRPAERIVLRLMRGDPELIRPGSANTDDAGPAEFFQFSQAQLSHFVRLRRICRDFELTVFAPKSLYVSADELCILVWLAAMQRGLLPLNRRLMALEAVLAHCALVLNEVGLKLPSLTTAVAERPTRLG